MKNVENTIEFQLHHLTEHVLDVACQTNALGIFQYVSSTSDRAIGYAPAELKGRSMFDFIHPDDHASLHTSIRLVVENKPKSECAVRFKHRDGNFRWLEMTVLRLSGGEDPDAGLMIGARDVTSFKKKEESLKNSRNQALKFSSLAAHELRNPLTIIRSQLENALDPNLGARQLRETIESVYDEMLRLSSVIDDLLNLSTMEAGTFKLKLEQINVEKFMKTFYDEALMLTRPKNISTVLKKGPAVFVTGDVSRLRQVFFNLLDNAIKHTDSGKQIRLSHSIEGPNVLITFADAGKGIPADVLPRIFDPFYRVDSTDMNSEGVGLGLALAQWVIDLHQGDIKVESMVGQGTTFLIRLPIAE
jgi:two-component system, cell cycle sensor histidine kinase DivJ